MADISQNTADILVNSGDIASLIVSEMCQLSNHQFYCDFFKDVDNEQNATILENTAGIAMNEAAILQNEEDITDNAADIASLRVNMLNS